MAAVELGPITGVGILGAGTAFPVRTLDNLDVLRGMPRPARRRTDSEGVDEGALRFLAEGTQGELERGGYLLSGAPDELLGVVPGKYLAALVAAFARAGVDGAALDLYVPHQTSAPLIAGVCEQAGIPAARAFVNVGAHANIGSAGWMAALCEARAAGRCKDGALVGLAAVGGGMSWGAAVLRW